MRVEHFSTRAAVLVLALHAVGCGYLDQDIHMGDEAFEASFSQESLSMGSIGCGGVGIGYYAGGSFHGYGAHGSGSGVVDIPASSERQAADARSRAASAASSRGEKSESGRELRALDGWQQVYFERVAEQRSAVVNYARTRSSRSSRDAR